MIEIHPATTIDADAWLRMRCALWPDGSETEHRDEIAQFFAGRSREPLAVLLAFDDSGEAVGFAELSIRNYAEDCATDRVGYLEGWYVVPEARRYGIGRALVDAAEKWAVGQGCREFGSDTTIDNEVSAAAHRALGSSKPRSSGAFGRTSAGRDAPRACRGASQEPLTSQLKAPPAAAHPPGLTPSPR